MYDTFTEMMNVRIHKGETIAAFANRFQGLLPADIDPDHTLVKYHFVSKLLSEVRMQQIRRLYEQKKNFDKITEECHTMYDWLLSRSNKDPG